MKPFVDPWKRYYCSELVSTEKRNFVSHLYPICEPKHVTWIYSHSRICIIIQCIISFLLTSQQILIICWFLFLQTGLITVDGWLKMAAPAQTAVIFKELRLTLHSILKELISKPKVTHIYFFWAAISSWL